MRTRTIWVSAVALAAAAGTVTAAAPAEAITGGSPASAGGRSLVPAVVRIDDSGPTLHCTGTLIAPQWVLTAQHCTNKGKVQGRPYSPAAITVKVNASASNPSRSVKVSEIWRMAGYNENTLVNDLAVVKLTAAVTDVTPIAVAGSPIPIDTNGYTYGFGPTGQSRSLWDVLRHPIAIPQPTTFPSLAELKVVGTDAAGDCKVAPNLTYVTSVRGFPVAGDSGGPILEWANGVPTLFDVFAGTFDRKTCQGGSLSRPADWVGVYNPVNRGSAGWQFITTYVPELGSAGR
jgi:secreted trypsin-like serine protease